MIFLIQIKNTYKTFLQQISNCDKNVGKQYKQKNAIILKLNDCTSMRPEQGHTGFCYALKFNR